MEESKANDLDSHVRKIGRWNDECDPEDKSLLYPKVRTKDGRYTDPTEGSITTIVEILESCC